MSSTPSPSPSPSPPEPTQLIINPGFEDPTSSPWILFPGDASIVASTDPQYGSKSMRVPRRAGLFTSVRQVPQVSEAGTYTASFSVKIDGTVGAPCFVQLTGLIEQNYGQVEVQEWTKFSGTAALAAGNNQFF
ncbi:hypothetical protein GT037_009431 [Alternaria burnsii]|uniref:CBM-cenC domain-containing protein n=1 Tax=Alternaria burnsii TaxID=1187904 RepID=A0A8H7B0G7_9PLEO|nr:uncharacterized protein GT037_009431 [Alternaria burnsii]KAF7672400.1 hypothetical protein GT037_009431 [Alternaria burnsii]